MFNKDNLHHAYFIEGERAAVLADIDAFLRNDLAIERQGHPDVHYFEYESFGIGEGRMLQEMQLVRPLVGERKIFIVAADTLTGEAQNSLLKVFEEPTEGTHFFLILSSRRVLLPTLLSRVVVISHPSARTAIFADAARTFLAMSPKERLAFVADMVEEKDKAKAEEFILALVSELRGTDMSQADGRRSSAIKELLTLSGYLKDRAPSVKLILERAALLNVS